MPNPVYVLSRVARTVDVWRAVRVPPPKRLVVGTERVVVQRALEMAESHSPAKLYRSVLVSPRRR